jgi:hypothetical protein
MAAGPLLAAQAAGAHTNLRTGPVAPVMAMGHVRLIRGLSTSATALSAVPASLVALRTTLLPAAQAANPNADLTTRPIASLMTVGRIFLRGGTVFLLVACHKPYLEDRCIRGGSPAPLLSKPAARPTASG